MIWAGHFQVFVAPVFPCIAFHIGNSEVPLITSVRCLQIRVNSTNEMQSNVSQSVAVLKPLRASEKKIWNYKLITSYECVLTRFSNKFAFSCLSSARLLFFPPLSSPPLILEKGSLCFMGIIA